MKMIKFLNIIAICTFSVSAWSESQFEAVALPMMKKAVLNSFVDTVQGSECPDGGSLAIDNVAEEVGATLSSTTIVTSLIDMTKPRLDELASESGRCGACQQSNQVAVFTTSVPEKTIENESCVNGRTLNIQKEMNSSDVQDFVASTLKGYTDEGKNLYQACPDPCSFSIVSATTARGSEKSLLNLTVQCGNPRAESILFAKYKFSSGLIQKWSCEAK